MLIYFCNFSYYFQSVAKSKGFWLIANFWAEVNSSILMFILFKAELLALMGPLVIIPFFPALYNWSSFYRLFEEYYEIAGDENTPS